MAVQFNSSSDRLLRTSGLLDYNAAYTIFLHGYIDSTGSYSSLANANDDSNCYDSLAINGTTLNPIISGAPNFFFTEDPGATVSSATWTALALIRASTTSLRAYKDAVASGSGLTNNVASRATATRMELGGMRSSNNDIFTGRIAYCRIWTAALTTGELAAEAASTTAVRTSGLWASYEFPNSGAIFNDSSGNGRHWTESGAVSWIDDPVIVGGGTGNAQLRKLRSGARIGAQLGF